jgi:Uma2 family endonuclease
LNLASAPKSPAGVKGCKVFMADAKVGVFSQMRTFHYLLALMVGCDPQDQDRVQIIYHPCLIVEVLSPGTEDSIT